MSKAPQTLKGKNARLREDVWRAVKQEAQKSRRTVTETLDYTLRRALKLTEAK